MLLGKLATPATKIYQNGAFSSTTATADYMVVKAQRYVIGEDEVTFEVRFGNLVTENDENRFDILLREQVKMSSLELASWGTDDTILLDLIASKLGNSLTEKITKDFHYTN
jgi:hypothetical protein